MFNNFSVYNFINVNSCNFQDLIGRCYTKIALMCSSHNKLRNHIISIYILTNNLHFVIGICFFDGNGCCRIPSAPIEYSFSPTLISNF